MAAEPKKELMAIFNASLALPDKKSIAVRLYLEKESLDIFKDDYTLLKNYSWDDLNSVTKESGYSITLEFQRTVALTFSLSSSDQRDRLLEAIRYVVQEFGRPIDDITLPTISNVVKFMNEIEKRFSKASPTEKIELKQRLQVWLHKLG